MHILFGAKNEIYFEQFLLSVGKERKTTFYADLSIAEWYGIVSVKDTYKNVMKSWGNDLEFMCEWVIALNQKFRQWYKFNEYRAKVYYELWQKADNHCRKHFKGKDLIQYYNYID